MIIVASTERKSMERRHGVLRRAGRAFSMPARGAASRSFHGESDARVMRPSVMELHVRWPLMVGESAAPRPSSSPSGSPP
jgi:hypothetical protein